MDVLFERFISRERDEAPDIDIDFEHERREEVLQYLYDKYGRERAGITAEVITYRSRSAVRDVGKALGLSLDRVDKLTKSLDGHHDGRLAERCHDVGLDPNSGVGRQLIALVDEIAGFPRHLGQHVGGMVITRGPLADLVPIENAAMPDRTVIQWNKDDLDTLGILKVDCLSLGMLTAIRKCLELVNAQGSGVGGRGREAGSRGQANRLTGVQRQIVPLPHSPTLPPTPDPRPLLPHPGHDSRRRPGRLRHDLPGRHDGRVSDREPRADEHVAAAEAQGVLRSGDRGGDRAARPDSGRHGASVSAPPRRGRKRSAIRTRRFARCCTRRSACRCFRSRRCGWPSWRPGSRRARPISCAARWEPGGGPA